MNRFKAHMLVVLSICLGLCRAMESDVHFELDDLAHKRHMQLASLLGEPHNLHAQLPLHDSMTALQTLARYESQAVLQEFKRLKLPDASRSDDHTDDSDEVALLSLASTTLVDERTQCALMSTLFDLYLQMYQRDAQSVEQLYHAIVDSSDVPVDGVTVARGLLQSWAHERAQVLASRSARRCACFCTLV